MKVTNSIFVVKNGHSDEFYGAYFENVAAFYNYKDAEEFKIKAELIHEKNIEIKKRFHNFLYNKKLDEVAAAQKASNGEMTAEQINDLDLTCDEWEIEEVSLIDTTETNHFRRS